MFREKTRRDVLRLTAGGVVAGAAVGAVPTTVSADGGDEVWSVELDGGVNDAPTVVEDTVYVRGGEYVYALDATDGSEIWSFDAETFWITAPQVIDGLVFVGASSELLCLDAAEGRPIWRVETEGTLRAPTVSDGVVYCTNSEGQAFAFDAGSGDEMWDFEIDDSGFGTAPTVSHGHVYAGGWNGKLYALDTETGDEAWHHEELWNVFSSPTVANDLVYYGKLDGNIFALDAESGEEEWHTEVDSTPSRSPTVADGKLFIGDQDDLMRALDADTGEPLWEFPTDGEPISSIPTVVDELLIFGSGEFDDEEEEPTDTHIYAVDIEDGSEVWRVDTGNFVESDPTVVDGVVYIGGANRNMYALEAGVEGSSADSRVNLGTYGHHDVWADQSEIEVTVTPLYEDDEDEDEDDEDDEDDERDDDPQDDADDPVSADEVDEDDDTDETADDADDDGPGFGVLGAVASLGGVSYLLSKRLAGDETDG